MTTTQTGEHPQSPATGEVINLGLGQPSPALLPLSLIHAAADRRLGRGADPLVLQYGAIAGSQSFREALADLLQRRHRMSVDPAELLVTGGISSALSWVGQLLAAPGRAAVCSDPTYFLARGIFEDLGLRLVGLEVDHGGLRVDVLHAELEEGLRPAFVYCMPSFHNPRGVDLEPARARRLIELAERYDFVVLADEPYVMLHFGEEPPRSLMAYDQGRGRVISFGSFSKILAPGLRLGWLHAAPSLIERCSMHGALRSGGGLNPVVASMVQGVIATGDLDHHIGRLRSTFRSRATALASALRRVLPEVEVTEASGGYFMWLELAKGVDTTALLERAAGRGVGFTPGSRCAVQRDLSRCLRLSFSFYEAHELVEGVERLAAVLHDEG